MSSSSTVKGKGYSKDKVSLMKLTKSNLLSNDMQTLKMSLEDVIQDYDPKLKTIYQDVAPSKTRLPKDDERSHCPVIILVLESVHKQVIKAINWKNFPLSGEAFPVFLIFCEKYITLNTLRLEDAQLQEADIILLATFLKGNPNITDLNLSGNPYQNNFNALIKDTKLKYLTLKFCGIGDEQLKQFIHPLKDAYKHSLLHLNLSNNNIGTEGAKRISEVLRINRILISLNLGCNKIANEGARIILQTLQTFHLNQEEISRRRKIYYQYYIKKYEQIKAASPSSFIIDDGKIPESKSSSTSTMKVKNKRSSRTKATSRSRKASRSATSLNELQGKSSFGAREITSAPAPSQVIIPPIAQTSDLVAMLDFNAAYHPFVKETTVDEFKFYCRGNFVLMHLNISFNHLTADILHDIHEMLSYQMTYGSSDEGLKSIVFYGNDLKSEGAEVQQQEIADILALKTVRTRSSGAIAGRELMPKRERKRSKN